MRSREELAWAAGFFEGEGWISVCGKWNNPKLGANQRTEEPIRKLEEALGLGRVRYDKKKNMWVWELSRFEHAQAALAMMWPWLSRRRKGRAVEVFGHFNEWKKTHRHGGLYREERIRARNGREVRNNAYSAYEDYQDPALD